MSDLDGAVVLVTGATSGVGAAVARAAARHGASVALVGRDAERGHAMRTEIEATGRRALFVAADIGDVAAVRRCCEEVIGTFGRIDGLANCAGLTSRGTLLDTTPQLFDHHVAVNLRAPFFFMQAAVADMRARGSGGTIVNVISSSELGGQPYLAPYVAAKAGLAGLTRNAAHAYRWDRIRINGVDIGWTETEGEDVVQRHFHDAGDDWVERANASVPMGRLGQVDDVAELVVLLLSSRSGVVTGSVIDWDQNVFGGLG